MPTSKMRCNRLDRAPHSSYQQGSLQANFNLNFSLMRSATSMRYLTHTKTRQVRKRSAASKLYPKMIRLSSLVTLSVSFTKNQACSLHPSNVTSVIELSCPHTLTSSTCRLRNWRRRLNDTQRQKKIWKMRTSSTSQSLNSFT